MKTMKLVLSIIVIAFLSCKVSWGQKVIHVETNATLFVTNDVYGVFYEGIGNVTGTYTYKITIKLSRDGYIESLHWNVVDYDLQTETGEKVIFTSTGSDNLGTFIWDFLNYPNYSNSGSNLVYDVTDGWLTDMMPPERPDEGHLVMMNSKMQCQGTKAYIFNEIIQIHRNAAGEITGQIVKTR